MLTKRTGVKLRQHGMILIEALIGILIFSMGILALVAMQTAAVSAQSDAQYRIEAGNLVDKMLYQISLNVDRTTSGSLQTSLAGFAHQAGGSSCNFSGTPSTNAVVTNWVTDATAAGKGLPGSTSAMQQILVDPANFNQVTVTLCWKGPNEITPHKHTVISYIN
jgi:type IV pilus assembly protein PilV